MNSSKKEKKKSMIKEAARILFIENGVDKTSFSEIAKGAEVGDATVYRYFSNKGDLATAIGIDYVEAVYHDLKSLEGIKVNQSVSKLEHLIDYYIELFISKPDYYIYLERFDNFISNEESKPANFELYEGVFADIKALSLTEEDGANRDLSFVEHVFSKNFVSHCQKLLLRGEIVKDDIDHDPLTELKLLKEVYLSHISTIKGGNNEK